MKNCTDVAIENCTLLVPGEAVLGELQGGSGGGVAEESGFCYVASLVRGGDAMFGSDKRVLLRHYLKQGMSKARNRGR